MIPKYSPETFHSAKSRELLTLECEYCHNPFLKTKHYIQDVLNPKQNKSASFCSRKCFGKSKLKIQLIPCLLCGRLTDRTPSELNKVKNTFCCSSHSAKYYNSFRIKPKIIKIKIQKTINKCLCCHKETLNKKYCSGACRNKLNNPNIKGSKSKAEKILIEQLKFNFPQFSIIENDRKILNGLELDVYIPELKLAIEWNGIFHYEPIHGLNQLEKIQHKDGKKIELCKSLGIELIIICDRTSHLRFIKETVNKLIENLKILARQ